MMTNPKLVLNNERNTKYKIRESDFKILCQLQHKEPERKSRETSTQFHSKSKKKLLFKF